MPRIDPLAEHELGAFAATFASAQKRFGFIPNSMLTMARVPAIAEAFVKLTGAVNAPGKVSGELKNLISQVVSRSAGCGYCMAHTAYLAGLSVGVAEAKEEALWEYETSPLFDAGERAALRVAQLSGQVPNDVSDADFSELKKHFDDDQIVEIVSVIALFGFLNRWNDTMATELESSPLATGEQVLAGHGWEVGKHA